MAKLRDLVVAGAGLFFLFYYFGHSGEQEHGKSARSSSGNSSLALASNEAAPQLPAAEQRFLDIVSRYKDAFEAAPNDMLKSNERRKRKTAMCELPTQAQAWIGTVETITTGGDDKGVLEIRLSDDTVVKTWNNSVSDFSDHTLIEPESQLFAALSQMKAGQRIKFSGSFLRDFGSDCFHEGSMTIRGSMTSPDWLMRFSNAAPDQ